MSVGFRHVIFPGRRSCETAETSGQLSVVMVLNRRWRKLEKNKTFVVSTVYNLVICIGARGVKCIRQGKLAEF